MDEDDDKVFMAQAAGHRIGEPLDNLSVQELGERIEALKDEILRLEEVRDAKERSLAAAAAFFKF